MNDGATATEKYLTGYVVEKSLSVDNIFVIAMIFSFFAVPPLYQHRVLFWGILGALVMRGAMIALGAKLIAEFHWVLYLFAVFLILTAIKMLFLKTEHADPNKNIVVRLTRRLFPVTARFHGEHFIVRAGAPASHESEIPGAPAVPDEVVEAARPGNAAPHAPGAGARHGRDDGPRSSPSTRSRPSSPSRATRSWSSPATSSRSSACGRSISRWPGWSRSSATSRSRSRWS